MQIARAPILNETMIRVTQSSTQTRFALQRNQAVNYRLFHREICENGNGILGSSLRDVRRVEEDDNEDEVEARMYLARPREQRPREKRKTRSRYNLAINPTLLC